MDDLTVFLITCGEESLNRCMESLQKQHLSGKSSPKLEVIRDVYPMSEAFNQMHKRCKTPYFLQVDSDVVLNDGAVQALYETVRTSPFFIYAAYGQLYEEGFGLGGSLRCWKKSIFNLFKFRDRRTVDRDFYNRARLLGFRRKKIEGVVGTHAPRHSNLSEYLKTKGDVEKWQFLKRPFARFAQPLYESLLADPARNRYKILGFAMGAVSSGKRISKSKDIKIEKERINSIFKLLDTSLDAFSLKKNTDLNSLEALFKKAYCSYSAGQKEIYAKEILEKLFGAADKACLEGLYRIAQL